MVYRVKASFVATGSIGITNCSRGIRNAWHFHYALVLGIKVYAAASVLRCSPLNRALVANEKNVPKAECLGLISMCF